ncbi:MAG: hypothetical protein UEJ45_06505 [Peptococcaceae bacterium]|nr:hypothetical protein [Peptococcaceae bacterium]
MYKIKNAQYGNLIEEQINPTWVKQQERVDRPILAESYEDADGIVLSDGNTMLGIAGRKMENYTPLVVIEEVNGEPYLMAQLEAVQAELEKAKKEQEATKSLMLDSMQGTADLYLAEQENKQLQLDTMQGIADLYAMQTGGEQ